MRIVTLGLVLLLSGFSFSSFAQARGYVGGAVGMSVPDYENTSSRLGYGVLGGARLDGEWGFGGFFFTSSNEESVNGTNVDFNYSLYGAEGSFHFEGTADGAFVGARLGIAKIDVKGPGGSANYSPMVWGLHVGYDYFLNESGSIGLEVGYMSVGEKKDAVNGDLKSFGMINFLIAGKFWL